MIGRRCFRFLIFVGVIWTAGCAHKSSPMLIGIYDAPQRVLPKLREAGFNLVTIASGETSQKDFLDAAAGSGISVILSPKLESDAGLRETARLDKHPALWAWYLADEPDLNFIAPEKLRESRRKLKSVARKPAYVVVASGAAVEKFRSIADIMAVDWYPIPWAPLATVSREMRNGRLASQGRPFLAILQAFDWKAYPKMLIAPEAPLRTPTY